MIKCILSGIIHGTKGGVKMEEKSIVLDLAPSKKE
jgi:hypothetical protein